MNSPTPPPWPIEGAVVMQRPNDAIDRAANYRHARECVSACWIFENPTQGIRTLLEGAQIAAAHLPETSDLRARLVALLARVEQGEAAAVPA